METDRIVIGREPNTGQSIYLMALGKIVCGGYTYQGKKSKDYRGLFETPWDMVDRRGIKKVLDISKYRYWNALNIYDEHIART